MSKENPKAAPEEVMSGDDIVVGNTMGRPTIFTQEAADEICELLATGVSLRTVCKADHLPALRTIFNWFRTYPEFLQQYTRAKEEAAEAMAEDIFDIADDGTNDWMEDNYDRGKTPGYALNGENIQRSKLRVDTRKWYLSKIKPKKYGDKLDVTTDGKALPSPIYGGLSDGKNQVDDDVRH